MNEARLFVGNLSFQTMGNDLQEYFSKAGVVASVNLVQEKFTGRLRGFAFIDHSTDPEAAKAVELFHSKGFQGRGLTVNIARLKEEQVPRTEGDNRRDGGQVRNRDH